MEINLLITWSNWFVWKHLTNKLDVLWIWYIRYKWDLLDIDNLISHFNKYNIKKVIHLVWSFDEPFENQLNINFETTKNILEIWYKYWLEKIIYTSTWAVYWEPLVEFSSEKDFCSPNTFYWLSKKMTEDLIIFYSNNLWMNSIILRFPNVYWEWNNKWVVYNFVNSIKKFNKVVIHWDWSQVRDFLYIDDAIQSIIKSINYNGKWIFNISSTNTLSLKWLINILKNKINTPFKIEYLEADTNNNLQKLSLNINEARKKLWYSPEFNDIVI